MDFINQFLGAASAEANFFKEYQILIVGFMIPAMMILYRVYLHVVGFVKTVLFLHVHIDEANNVSGSMYYNLARVIEESRIKFITKNFELSSQGYMRLGSGFNMFYYEGGIFFINTSRREAKGFNNEPMGTGNVSFFRWNLKRFEKLTDELAKLEDQSPPMMAFAEHRGWDYVMDLPDRLKDQIQYIEPAMYELIDSIFQRFINNPESYAEFGQAYKEAFMLYGAPGTGKTNLARHFAAKYGMDLIIVEAGMVSKTMFNARRRLSNGKKRLTLYLIEDIDSNKNLCKDRATDSMTKDVLAEVQAKAVEQLAMANDIPAPTIQERPPSMIFGDELSTFLNVLDGAIPLDGCMAMITTNFPGKLYKSIYRLGRMDHRLEINYMNFNEVSKLLNWTADNPVYQYMLTQPMRDILPANAINRLRFATTADQARIILDDVKSAQELSDVIC